MYVPDPAPARILIVDDAPKNVQVFTRLMVGLGYDVASASSGESALESVARQRPI